MEDVAKWSIDDMVEVKLKDVAWNPYDETLKANFKSKWREDSPPDEED